jgi:hypothetical protein
VTLPTPQVDVSLARSLAQEPTAPAVIESGPDEPVVPNELIESIECLVDPEPTIPDTGLEGQSASPLPLEPALQDVEQASRSSSTLPQEEGPGVRDVAPPEAREEGSLEDHSTGDAPLPGGQGGEESESLIGPNLDKSVVGLTAPFRLIKRFLAERRTPSPQPLYVDEGGEDEHT